MEGEYDEHERLKIKSVQFIPGCHYVTRSGLFGWLIDAIIGKRVVLTGASIFIAISEDGRILTSPDSATWTMRDTPSIKCKYEPMK